MDEKEIKPGDVLFVWGTNMIDDAIEVVTHGPSHCALFLDSETLAEAQGGRTIGEAKLSDYLSSGDQLEVWRDELLTDDDRSKMVTYARKQYGLHYDYLAILVELARYELHRPINSFREGKRRICSSYVYDCAESVGKEWTDVKVPAPVQLLQGKKLTKKGVLACLTPTKSVKS